MRSNHSWLQVINRWVFNSLLNVIILSLDLIRIGREFHSFGPRTLNAFSAKLAFLTKGTTRTISPLVALVAARVLLVKDLSLIRSLRYDGAVPFRHLNTRQHTLKSILWRIGSQWSCLRASLELSHLVRQSTTLAGLSEKF